MKLLTVLSLVYSAWAVNSAWAMKDVNTEFNNFKRNHQVTYRDNTEETKRLKIFKTNYNKIYSHNLDANAGYHSFTLGINQFADMTNAEYRQFNGFKHSLKVTQNTNKNVYNKTTTNIPTVDWRNSGLVTPIKDQGGCGSCYAFSAVASIESQHCVVTGNLVSLSEQNLVDCSTSQGNAGCNGGLMDQAFAYVIKNKGIATESSYPYNGVQGNCIYKANTKGATIAGFTDVKSGDENALQSACADYGPISVAIDASSQEFQLYKEGVYTDSLCGNTLDSLDHGVAVVAFGTDNGQDYWLVKNSWGTSWGEAGYIRMSRNVDNQCGIATCASFPNGVN